MKAFVQNISRKDPKMMHPQAPYGPNCESKCEDNERKRSWAHPCEYLLHTFTTKVCTHIKPGWKWNYYVVVV